MLLGQEKSCNSQNILTSNPTAPGRWLRCFAQHSSQKESPAHWIQVQVFTFLKHSQQGSAIEGTREGVGNGTGVDETFDLVGRRDPLLGPDDSASELRADLVDARLGGIVMRDLELDI